MTTTKTVKTSKASKSVDIDGHIVPRLSNPINTTKVFFHLLVQSFLKIYRFGHGE